MWGSQSWLRRTFPGPALAGLKAGCRQDCLPHIDDAVYERIARQQETHGARHWDAANIYS